MGYSIKTKFCLEELTVSGCLGWSEFSSSISVNNSIIFSGFLSTCDNIGVVHQEEKSCQGVGQEQRRVESPERRAEEIEDVCESKYRTKNGRNPQNAG